MVVELTPCPEGWPGNSNFVDQHTSCDEGYFNCDAVELAEKLVGQYLYCHESKIVVRILETEAFPEADDAQVHKENFGSPSPFKFDGGQIISCKRDGTGQYSSVLKKLFLYITAGTASSGDVVLLRSGEPIEGHHLIEGNRNLTIASYPDVKKNLLIGPVNLFRGLGREWESSTGRVLYEKTGIQLYLADANEERDLLRGTRQLFGDEKEFRFALKTDTNYNYWNKGKMKSLRREITAEPSDPAIVESDQ